MKVLVVHPYRETVHKFWKEYFFMPDRAISMATYLDEQGHDVDFKDFGQTDLEDDHTFTVPLPKGLRGTGETMWHYGWPESEMEQWLDTHLEQYEVVVVDSLMPYFRKGVKQVVDKADEVLGRHNVALFGEWVALNPNDFHEHVAIDGSWEAGIDLWIKALKGYENELTDGGETRKGYVEPGAHHVEYRKYPMSNLPTPDWTRFVDLENYPESHRVDYRAHRGCPERCDFCHVAGVYDGRFNLRPAENIIRDLRHYIEEDGVGKVHLRDDNFCAAPKIAKEVFNWLGDEHPDIEILQCEGVEMKTATQFPEVIEAMGRTNYHSVRVGFETAKMDHFAKNSRDRWDTAYEHFTELAGFGPDEIVCFAIVGHPKLSREAEIDTAIFLSQYNVRIIPASYREVPGTPLYNEGTPYEQGLKRPQEDDKVEDSKRLYRVVSNWNQEKLDLFHTENFWEEVETLDWVDKVDYSDSHVSIEGTTSGWDRGDAIRWGAAVRFALNGYYNHEVVENTNERMEIRGMKGMGKYMQMLADRAEQHDIPVQSTGGLI